MPEGNETAAYSNKSSLHLIIRQQTASITRGAVFNRLLTELVSGGADSLRLRLL